MTVGGLGEPTPAPVKPLTLAYAIKLAQRCADESGRNWFVSLKDAHVTDWPGNITDEPWQVITPRN